MKAAVYYGPRDIRIEERPVPRPGANPLLVKVDYVGICGTDVHSYYNAGLIQPVRVLGHETDGTVAALGVANRTEQRLRESFFAQVGRLRKQRVLAVDASQGLVLIATIIDHPGDVETVKLKQGDAIPVPEAFRPPSAYLRTVLLKVRAGRIRHVEVSTRQVGNSMALVIRPATRRGRPADSRRRTGSGD